MRRRDSQLLSRVGDRRVYFVHSYRATPSPENNDWVLATTEYGGSFISAVHKGEICATQFHPEKSGSAGLDIIESFLEAPAEPQPAYTNGEPLGIGCSYLAGVSVYRVYPSYQQRSQLAQDGDGLLLHRCRLVS